MKKSIFILFLVLSFTVSAQSPDDAVISRTSCQYITVRPDNGHFPPYKGEIEFTQLHNDLQHFKYLLCTSYAGYDDAVEKGLDIDRVIASVEEKFRGSQSIYTYDFINCLKNELSPYITDSHFGFCLGATPLVMSVHKDVYFTDVFIMPEDKEQFEKQNPGLELLRCVHEDSLMYRAALFSSQIVSNADVVLNGIKQQVRVYEPTADKTYNTVLFKGWTTPFSAAAKLTSFYTTGNKVEEENIDNFLDFTAQCNNKSSFIFDLRSNSGGYGSYAQKAMKNLVYKRTDNMDKKVLAFIDKSYSAAIEKAYDGCFVLSSPATLQFKLFKIQNFCAATKQNTGKIPGFLKKERNSALNDLKNSRKNPERVTKKLYKAKDSSEKVSGPRGTFFKGNIYILVNRNSSSCSEEFIMLATHFFGADRVVVVGENTSGTIEYGSVNEYMLPECQVDVCISNATYGGAMARTAGWKGEGCGIMPDYWCTSEDIGETLAYLTGDSDLGEIPW